MAALTRPAPWTSMAGCENCCVMVRRSLEIWIGYLNVMEASLETLLTSPWQTHSCQTVALSHCCVTRISTAWASVHSRYAGTASESCVCSCAIHVGLACVWTRFHKLTNVSSMVLYRLIRSSRPTATGLSEGTSSKDGG